MTDKKLQSTSTDKTTGADLKADLRPGKLPWRKMITAFVLTLLASLYYLGDGESIRIDDKFREEQGGSFVQLSQGYTHYELEGRVGDPLVVLVHGFSAGKFIWENNVKSIRNAGYRTLRFDLYGRGYSDRPDVEYNAELYDTQLLELLDRLGQTEPVTVMGLSMGGAITIRFAHKHPDRVKQIVLVDPAGIKVDLPFKAKLARWPFIGDFIMRAFGDRLLLGSLSNTLLDQSRTEELKSKYAEQMRYYGFKNAILSTLRHMPFDTNAWQPDIEAYGKSSKPVMIIWGRQDKVIAPANAEVMHKLMPQSTLHYIEQSGHNPNWESPEKVNPLLLEFLAKNK